MHLWAHDPWSAQDMSTSSEKCSPVYTEYIIQSTEYRTSTRITLDLFFHLYPASVGPLSHNQAMCCTKSDSCGLCFPNIPHFSRNLRQPQPDHVCLLVEVEKAETEDSANSDTCKDRCSRMGGNPCSVPEVDSIFFIFVLKFYYFLFFFKATQVPCKRLFPSWSFLVNEDYLWKYVSRVETTRELVVCKTSFIFFLEQQFAGSSDHLDEGSFCKVQTLRDSRHETRKYETPLIYLLSEMYFEAARYIVYAEPITYGARWSIYYLWCRCSQLVA